VALPKTGPVAVADRVAPLDQNVVFARDGANLPLGPNGAPSFTCLAFTVSSPEVKAVAIYRPQVSQSPYMVVDESSEWMTCLDEGLGFHKLVAQPLDARQKVLQSIPIGFTTVARPVAPVTQPEPTPTATTQPSAPEQAAPKSEPAPTAPYPPLSPAITQANFESARGGQGDTPDRK
jgi:hypothetical protein